VETLQHAIFFTAFHCICAGGMKVTHTHDDNLRKYVHVSKILLEKTGERTVSISVN